MGNCRSELRTAIRANDHVKVRSLLEDAGPASANLINEDHTANCLFGCLMRNHLSPLHTAIIFNQKEIIESLLQYGADVEARTYWYQTPLHLAARFNCIYAAKLLISRYKADIEARDNEGNTPLHTAALSPILAPLPSADGSVLEYILKTTGEKLLNSGDDLGNTPLHKACMFNNVTAVFFLLQNKADTELCNNDNLKPADVAKPNALRALNDFQHSNKLKL